VQRIGVIGGGTMGAGIAEVSSKAGCDVVVAEISAEASAAGLARIEKSVARSVTSGKVDEVAAKELLARIRFTEDLAELGDRELVVEAAPEVESIKLDLFRRLDDVLPASAVLASNTSSIPIVKMAAVTRRPDRVVGVHFFNPVPVLPLVEVVETLLSAPEAVAAVTTFAEEQLGKVTIRSKDRAGFVVNALLVPYLLSAIRMLESGFASAEDIDKGMVKGCNHPIGPLALTDMIGLDTTALIADSLFDEFKDPACAAPPLLKRLVDAGRLGRKSGQGFFSYA
jgi:3-hydroxybutyryl-CoA dehydrogenase